MPKQTFEADVKIYSYKLYNIIIGMHIDIYILIWWTGNIWERIEGASFTQFAHIYWLI